MHRSYAVLYTQGTPTSAANVSPDEGILENTAGIPMPSATMSVAIGTGHLQNHQRSIRAQARGYVRNRRAGRP
jgi:hypothetical protein